MTRLRWLVNLAFSLVVWGLVAWGMVAHGLAKAADLTLTCAITSSSSPPGQDPVVGISLNLGKNWSVVHHTQSGQSYARRDQYFIKSTLRKPGGFVWRGMSFRKPGLTMIGIASRDRADHWSYREFTHEIAGRRVLTSRMLASCVKSSEAGGTVAKLPDGPVLAQWDAKQGARTVETGGLSLSFTSVGAAGEVPHPQITLRGIGVPTEVIDLKDAEASYGVAYGVLRLDPDHAAKDVLISGYAGGAHCCSVNAIASLVQGQWKLVMPGKFDGYYMKYAPVDLNHDGVPDFAIPDNAFYYRFTDYADSAAPDRFYRLDDGRWVDESTSPSFRPIYIQEMARYEPGCRLGHHGLCAAYVAAGARAGQFQSAWRFMLAHINKTSTWDIPDCPPDNGDCNATTRDYVGALARFLRLQGYIE